MLPNGFRVAETRWDGSVPPETFSREGALIRRSDVAVLVQEIGAASELPWRFIIST
jgi:hypothetical protein